MKEPVEESISDSISQFDFQAAGQEMQDLIRKLYPLCRSITGDGNRQTLAMLPATKNITRHEVPSGTPVFDWVVPPEWNVREAWIKDPDGKLIVDFRNQNLHVVGYSTPVHCTLPLHELSTHLHSLPDLPDRIPYRTSYYRQTWGFCITDEHRQLLTEGDYEVFIDADLKPGYLVYGEALLPGKMKDEFLISVHLCHPSLANDNLSGLAVADQILRVLKTVSHRFSYRFLFIPGTIGSITWLAQNPEAISRIRHGLVLSCLGDPGNPNYKRSRHGNAIIDQAAVHVLQHQAPEHGIEDFIPYGYDERQYGSPGINLPVGLFTRSPHGTFPEYHTSADTPDFVRPDKLADSLRLLLEIIHVVEQNRTCLNTHPMGEPQLGKRGLYDTLGGANDRHEEQMALLWVLNLSDGHHSLLDIANRARLPWYRISCAASRLTACGLLKEHERSDS